MVHSRRIGHTGFALIDLILVLAILATIAGIVVPAVHKVHDAAARTQTANNLKQCALAAHGGHDQYKFFPPYFGKFGQLQTTDHSFFVHLLPFVESGPVYTRVLTEGSAVLSKVIYPAYLAPSDYTQINDGVNCVNFAVNLRLWAIPEKSGPGTGYAGQPIIPCNVPLFFGNAVIKVRMPSSFADGMSNTILFATRCHQGQNNGDEVFTTIINGSPYDNNGPYFGNIVVTFDNTSPGSKVAANNQPIAGTTCWQPAPTRKQAQMNSGLSHSFSRHDIQVALCDAGVRSCSAEIAAKTWGEILTPAGGEVPPLADSD